MNDTNTDSLVVVLTAEQWEEYVAMVPNLRGVPLGQAERPPAAFQSALTGTREAKRP